MTDPSSPPAPMTEDRIAQIRRSLFECATEPFTYGWRGIVTDLLAHIDALTARVATLESELAATRKVEDGEVSAALEHFRKVSAFASERRTRKQQMEDHLSGKKVLTDEELTLLAIEEQMEDHLSGKKVLTDEELTRLAIEELMALDAGF